MKRPFRLVGILLRPRELDAEGAHAESEGRNVHRMNTFPSPTLSRTSTFDQRLPSYTPRTPATAPIPGESQGGLKPSPTRLDSARDENDRTGAVLDLQTSAPPGSRPIVYDCTSYFSIPVINDQGPPTLVMDTHA